jgi:Xaa-Pro dipeptidase
MPGPAFAKAEYESRLSRVRARMAEREIELLLIADPANMNYVTGYDGWSFYVPQLVAVPSQGNEDPLWLGRAMDRAQAPLTSWLPESHVIGYPESYVQRPDRHPMDWIADYLKGRGWDGHRIGVETDVYYFSPKALERLRAGLPNANFVDADLLVNWVRAVKSPAEIACMREAARLVGGAMRAAFEVIAPGVRQCDAIARIYAAQIAGEPGYAGDITSLCPLIMSGPAAAAAHPMWTDERFERDQTTAIELGGARHHYHASLARTLHIGQPPRRLIDTAKIVEEGLEAALATMRPGTVAGDVEAAWRRVLDRHGLKKESRIGYSIGLGYPPDWGEHTISLRPGDATVLEPGNTFHIILGMWMEGWGMETSETVLVTERGAECLTQLPRGVHVKN